MWERVMCIRRTKPGLMIYREIGDLIFVTFPSNVVERIKGGREVCFVVCLMMNGG